jgi:hypothetical protein
MRQRVELLAEILDIAGRPCVRCRRTGS